MPELNLAERAPLAHCIVPGRHGRSEGEPGVTLAARNDLALHMVIARSGKVDEARRLASVAGLALPAASRVTMTEGLMALWSGPEQWLIATEAKGRAASDQVIAALAPCCMIVEQTDARAVITISGPQAREALAKGFPVDLHPRVFKTGTTALTLAAAVPAQIWQSDDEPSFGIAVPRSFAEGFWRWLAEASAEFGVTVSDSPAGLKTAPP